MEVTRSHLYPLGSLELQAELRANVVGDLKEDYCRDMTSHRGSGNNQFSSQQDAQESDVRNCKGAVTYDKASEDVGAVTQFHSENNCGSGILENAFSSPVSSTVEAPLPSFTFDVSCVDGIQLYVDLNSTQSDWIESIKAGVDVCGDDYNLKSHDAHHLGQLCCPKQSKGPSLGGSHKETNDDKNESDSYPTIVKLGVMPQADEHGGGGGSSPSTGQKSLRNTVIPDLRNTGLCEAGYTVTEN